MNYYLYLYSKKFSATVNQDVLKRLVNEVKAVCPDTPSALIKGCNSKLCILKQTDVSILLLLFGPGNEASMHTKFILGVCIIITMFTPTGNKDCVHLSHARS